MESPQAIPANDIKSLCDQITKLIPSEKFDPQIFLKNHSGVDPSTLACVLKDVRDDGPVLDDIWPLAEKSLERLSSPGAPSIKGKEVEKAKHPLADQPPKDPLQPNSTDPNEKPGEIPAPPSEAKGGPSDFEPSRSSPGSPSLEAERIEGGWIKLYRQLITNGWLKNHKMLAFWIYCLLKASYGPIKMIVGYQEVQLESGQFIFGRKKASQETKLSEQEIRTCLVFLRKAKNLTIKSTNKFSIISITNWERYQGSKNGDQPTNQQTSNQQVTTNKNEKNDQEEILKEGASQKPERIGYGEFKNVLLSESDLDSLYAKFKTEEVDSAIESMSNWLRSKGKSYKDYRAALYNWIAKDRKSLSPKVGKSNVYREPGKKYPTGTIVRIDD